MDHIFFYTMKGFFLFQRLAMRQDKVCFFLVQHDHHSILFCSYIISLCQSQSSNKIMQIMTVIVMGI